MLRLIRVLSLSVTFFVTFAAQAQDAVELRIGSSVPKTDQISVSLDKFAELLASKSNGKVTGRVFYQSLGIEHQLLQGAQAGSLDIGMISNGNAGRYTAAYYVLDLPFLFKRYEDMLDYLTRHRGKKLRLYSRRTQD